MKEQTLTAMMASVDSMIAEGVIKLPTPLKEDWDAHSKDQKTGTMLAAVFVTALVESAHSSEDAYSILDIIGVDVEDLEDYQHNLPCPELLKD